MTRPRTTTLALLRGILGADRRLGAVVVIVALVASALLAALPRAVSTLADAIVADRIAGTTPLVRDLDAKPTEIALGPAPAGASSSLPVEWDAELGLIDSALESTRSTLAQPVAGIVEAGRFRVATRDLGIAPTAGHDVRYPKVQLVADPYVQDYATLTAGRWAAARMAPPEGEMPNGATEVTLAESSALRLGWEIGETRAISITDGLTLVGTYAVDDPTDRYWTHSPAAAAPRIVDDLNSGITVVAAAYIGPSLEPMIQYLPRLSLWYPIEASGLTAADLHEVSSQLRGFTAVRQDVGVPANFSTELVPVLETAQRDVVATSSIVAFLASGPIAVLMMLLVAALRMLQEHQRPTLALLRSRGASGIQTRAVGGAEGLVLGVLGAGAGALVVAMVLPGTVAAVGLAGPVLVALTPAIVLATSSVSTSLRPVRARRSRLRWVWEAMVLAAATLATVQLLRRGLGGEGGPDPMLVAVPALVAVAVAVVVVRCAPALLAVVVTLVAAGRGALSFVGAASAQREGRGRLPSAVGLVVAVTVAVLSTVLLSTVRSGLEIEAWTAVGADLRISGPIVDDATLDQVRAVDGVAAATTVTDVTSAALTTDEGRYPVQVLLVDGADLAEVQEQVPGWSVPTDLGDSAELGPSALLAEGFASSPGRVNLSVANHTIDLTMVGSAPAVPGASRGTRWVMLERSVVTEVTGASYHPRVLLVRLDDALAPDQVETLVDQVTALTGPGAAQLQSEAVAERLADPTVRGLQTSVLVALVAAFLLGAATVAASEAAAQPRRERLFAVLEILGMPRRQGQVVSVWEVASWTVPSIFGGLALGLVLPALVARVVDLRSFTGGSGAVELEHAPGWVALVLGVFVVVVAACGIASAALGRKVSSAALLRSVQE